MSELISAINIKSFRGIDSLKLDNLQQINILTGDNNSGKTSVLEVISTFNQPDNFRSWLDVSREDGLIGGISVYERVNDFFNVNCEKKKVEYVISSNNQDTRVEMVAYDMETTITKKDYYHKLGYAVVSDEENQEDGEQDMIVTKTHIELNVNGERGQSVQMYEGQRRLPISLKKPLKKYAENIIYISPFGHVGGKIFLSDVLNNPELYEEMLEVLKEFDPGIISINYDDGGDPRRGGFYKILSKENNRALPLNMYGDGMKKAILLMSAAVKAKDGILLLDEFETAIHTSAMDKVFKWILDTCLKLNVQVFMTSHSKEAIRKVLSCSDELQEHMAIYTLYKDEEGNSVRRMTAKNALRLNNEMGLELR